MANHGAGYSAGILALLGFCTLVAAADGLNVPADSADPQSPAKVVAVSQALHQRFKHADGFYKKAVDAGGIWIMSSQKVDDRALLEVRYLILSVLKGRPDVREAMVAKNVRIGVMSHDEFTTDIPEHRRLSPWWNMRARGLGGNPVTCGAENILNYKGDPYRGENILIHEFAHVVAKFGLREVDKTFGARLQTIFDKAKTSGLFQGYGITSRGEFWAEGVQSWFECNTGGLILKKDAKGKRKPLLNRADLKEHLPDLARLLADSLGKNNWLYTTTDKRLDMPHLKGYDRDKAPQFKWPKHIVEAARADQKRINARKKEREKKKREKK